MSERIRGSYDNALYKSTFTLLYFTLPVTVSCKMTCELIQETCTADLPVAVSCEPINKTSTTDLPVHYSVSDICTSSFYGSKRPRIRCIKTDIRNPSTAASVNVKRQSQQSKCKPARYS